MFTITNPGQEFRRLKNGKDDDSSITFSKCPDCGEIHRCKAKTGVFIHRCEKCDMEKKKVADQIGR